MTFTELLLSTAPLPMKLAFYGGDGRPVTYPYDILYDSLLEPVMDKKTQVWSSPDPYPLCAIADKVPKHWYYCDLSRLNYRDGMDEGQLRSYDALFEYLRTAMALWDMEIWYIGMHPEPADIDLVPTDVHIGDRNTPIADIGFPELDYHVLYRLIPRSGQGFIIGFDRLEDTMAYEGQLRKIDDNRWEIPQDESLGMRTNAVIFASETMLSQIRSDNAPSQAANVACLPGIVGSSMAMPDIHWGYGFPIGGVAAVDADSGSISPGGIGFDINCGVRLIKTDLTLDDIGSKKEELIDELYRNVPSGLGSKGLTHVGPKEMEDILNLGSEWAVENGYGWESDLDVTEERGCMSEAYAYAVSGKARKRGLQQLGSLGSGNHFLELDVVENVFDESVAKVYGLKEGAVTITVHCGSRGCGHQIATEYLQEMERYVKANSIQLPDRQLACAPLDSLPGKMYYYAMCCGANYAWANRQMITHWCRESFEKVLGDSAESMGMDVVYDVAHNIAKKERHDIEGHHADVLVHRKGATRAFAPGRSEITMKYRDAGQPVIIPGDMSVGTYVLAGRKGAMKETFGSSCHGAGRKMSRNEAIRSLSADSIRKDMAARNIYIRSGTEEGVCEEAPQAYKDVDEVIKVVCDAGLTDKVAKLTPIGVIKGRGP